MNVKQSFLSSKLEESSLFSQSAVCRCSVLVELHRIGITGVDKPSVEQKLVLNQSWFLPAVSKDILLLVKLNVNLSKVIYSTVFALVSIHCT